jgi:6-pyruvoyltetrahydropterin/6-carboxytetrahydropterin synthase
VKAGAVFTVAVKDHVMVAHSLRGAVFGPAQKLHGATFAVTAEWSANQLDGDGIVLDIGRAQESLTQVLEPLRYQNLDELAEFRGVNTTAERLAQWIHGQLAKGARGFVGRLRVVLEESPVAWAAFEAPVG